MPPLVPGRGTMVKGPGITVMPGRMQFDREPSEAAAELVPGLPMPRRESCVRWVLLVPPDHPAAAAPSQEDARGLVLELIGGWYPDLRALVESADLSAVGRAEVFDRPVPPWPASRVTLLGDAAHQTLAGGGNGAVRLSARPAEVDRGRQGAAVNGRVRSVDGTHRDIHRAIHPEAVRPAGPAPPRPPRRSARVTAVG
jgi:hypothetical protein